MSMKAMKVQHNNKEEKSKSSSEVVEVLEAKREEEWIAKAEPGVYITLVALPNGSNLLKKICFRYLFFLNKNTHDKYMILLVGILVKAYNVCKYLTLVLCDLKGGNV